MATPKQNADFNNWLVEWAERRKKLKAESPIVKERWWVVDYFPPRRESDEYSDYWTDTKETRVSIYFDSEAEAQTFVSTHNPATNAELLIRHENLRRITREEWVAW